MFKQSMLPTSLSTSFDFDDVYNAVRTKTIGQEDIMKMCMNIDMEGEKSPFVSIVQMLRLAKCCDTTSNGDKKCYWKVRECLISRWKHLLDLPNTSEEVPFYNALPSEFKVLRDSGGSKRVYIDGVFDMLHIGHIQALEDAVKTVREGALVVGVIGDSDATGYKRKPIIDETERATMLSYLPIVSQVITNAPLVMTEEFITTHNIDIVVHSFSDDADFERQKPFFEVPIRLGIFRRISYHPTNSTSEIIKRCVASVTGNSPTRNANPVRPDCVPVPPIGDEATPDSDIRGCIDDFTESIHACSEQHLGYPYNLDIHTEAQDARLLRYSLNNLGDPWVGSNYGMQTRIFEQRVVEFMVRFFGGTIDMDRSTGDWWGAMTTCGTEGNMNALAHALRLHPDAHVYASRATHYSIEKICRNARAPYHVVDTNEFDEIDYENLREHVTECQHPCIVVCNIGTTMRSGVDDLSKVRKVLEEERVSFFIHCDAALAGMLITPETPVLNMCDSMGMSFHKFLGTSMPCGVVLCKRVATKGNFIDYLHSIDTTVGGSRNGFTPLQVWRSLSRHGLIGLRRLADENLKKAKDVLERFHIHGVTAQLQLTTIVFEKPFDNVIKKWQLACTDTIAHIVVMPSTTMESIESFLSDYTQSVPDSDPDKTSS